MINDHPARPLPSGVAEMETLRCFSDLVGNEEVKDPSDPDAPLAPAIACPPDKLRRIKSEHGLLIYGASALTMLRLRVYFNDRKLKKAA
jgi:hypothetical protein